MTKLIRLMLAILSIMLLTACSQSNTGGKQYPPGAVVCTPELREGQACTMEYIAVCGNNDKTYGNKCMACHDADVQYYIEGACASDQETSPPDNSRVAFTQCSDPRPEICTKEYNPVCGATDNGIRCIRAPCPSTDNQTYGNACEACSNGLVFGYWPGACGNMPSDTPGTVAKSFQDCAAHNSVVNSSPRTCAYEDGSVFVEQFTLCDDKSCSQVDKCPTGSSVYGSQTGPACVKHYTADDLATWKSCETANDCSTGYCAYTPRTPDGTAAKDEKLHCLPIDYYAFLLHTSGVSGVDENGEQFSVIA